MSEFKELAKLNEKEGFTDILILEKHILSVYATVIEESTSEGFRAVVNKHLNEAVSDQFSVFLQMTDRGFYKVETAKEEQVQQVRESYKQTLKEIND
ncbi:MAG: spore coat protein [Clostridiales bacterium]|nr:spore coat protein [Clostridiales bacterium]